VTDQDPVEGFLAHYGVKGQKWGVRKPRGDRDRIFRERYENRNKPSKSGAKKDAGRKAAEQVLESQGDQPIPPGTDTAKAGESLIQRFFFGDKSQPKV
jgi:hypothetical protein